MKVSFSPPDMTEQEAQEVREAILSGWTADFGICAHREDSVSELGYSSYGDGFTFARRWSWR